jgi:predicted GH43/DUF377 family glycosyl hydrolase
VAGEEIQWAAKDVFNPGAVVYNEQVHLLVRCEDRVGRDAGTSRIGLASSQDGVHFTLRPEPVIYPDHDEWQSFEWPGGCEDPRVVASPDGGFVCFYTAFDGRVGRLFVATSDDLLEWTKHGPAFAETPYAARSSKSGAVVTRLLDGQLLAERIDGRYWMYWGEGVSYAATSNDLVHWDPLDYDATGDRELEYVGEGPAAHWTVHRTPGQRALKPVLFPRRGGFDSLLVEPGAPALMTRTGIALLYNGANHFVDGDPAFPAFSYQPGCAMFDAVDPSVCLSRTTSPLLMSREIDADDGQVGNVCFVQSLVRFNDQWRVYFGMADSRIGTGVVDIAT